MPTESFYSDDETARILRDERLLAMNKGKKTALVNQALKEYHRNHAELDQPRKTTAAGPLVAKARTVSYV